MVTQAVYENADIVLGGYSNVQNNGLNKEFQTQGNNCKCQTSCLGYKGGRSRPPVELIARSTSGSRRPWRSQCCMS